MKLRKDTYSANESLNGLIFEVSGLSVYSGSLRQVIAFTGTYRYVVYLLGTRTFVHFVRKDFDRDFEQIYRQVG